MAETCLDSAQLAYVIFGAIFGTLVICVGFAFVLWCLIKKHRQEEKILVLERGSGTLNKSDVLASEHRKSLTVLQSEKDELDSKSKKVVTCLPPFPVKNNVAASAEPAALASKIGFSIASKDKNTVVEEVQRDICHADIRPGDRLCRLEMFLDDIPAENIERILAAVCDYAFHLEIDRISQDVSQSNPQLQTGETSAGNESNALTDSVITTTTMATSVELQSFNVSPARQSGHVKNNSDKVEVTEATIEFCEESSLDNDEGRPPSLPSVSPPLSSRRTSTDSSLNVTTPKKLVAEAPVISRIWPGTTKISPMPLPLTTPVKTKMDENVAMKEKEVAQKHIHTNGLHAGQNGQSKHLRDDDSEMIENKSRSGQLYDEIKDQLQKDGSDFNQQNRIEVESKTAKLTEVQYATLESNRKRLERERQQLKDLGILS